MKYHSFVLCLLFFFTVSVFSQKPAPTPPAEDDDRIKISTNLIQVDVTVTDKKGNVVTDLKPEDFEVYENGKKQEITNFSLISVNKEPVEHGARSAAKSDRIAVPIPPVKLKAEQVRRTYALVVDDLGLNFASIFWVRQSLKKFINEQVQEGDLVAVIRTGAGIGALQSFTSDKRQLLAAVDKIKWNPQGRGGTSTFEPINVDSLQAAAKTAGSTDSGTGTGSALEFQKQVDELRNDNFSVGTLGSLNYIIKGMQNLPGRKAVMLFSEGFVLTYSAKTFGGNTGATTTRVLGALRVLADLANRSSVVVYTIDPRGLQNVEMFSAQDNILTDPSPGSLVATTLEGRVKDFRETQASLTYLAVQTGGIPFINQNSIDKGLRQAVSDQSSYYLLGYQPDEDTFDPKKNVFNKLEIKLTRPDLKVRYHSGFFAFTDEKLKNVERTPQQKIVSALTSPFSANEVNLSLYPVFQNDAKIGDLIQALVYIDARDLSFAEADGKRRANFDLLAMTFGDNGAPVSQLSKNYTLEITEKVYQNMLEKGFVYTLPVPIKKTGAYQFRIALRDTGSNKVGSASQFIEVPNIKKRMVLSNLVLDNFTADEWQKVRLGAPESGDDSGRSVLLDTTLRRFRSGTVVRYDYVIYNPKQSRALKTQMRLIKDGKVVYQENPSSVKIDGQSDIQRVQTAGAVSLGKDLTAGNYVLQVIATDDSNEKKYATQFVEFEIVE
jgi:VWFA-related protein